MKYAKGVFRINDKTKEIFARENVYNQKSPKINTENLALRHLRVI